MKASAATERPAFNCRGGGGEVSDDEWAEVVHLLPPRSPLRAAQSSRLKGNEEGKKEKEKSRSEGEMEFLRKEAPTRWRPRSEGATRRTEKVVLPLAAFINLYALRPGVTAAAA